MKVLVAAGFALAAAAMSGSPAEAGCKTLDGGYVGFNREGVARRAGKTLTENAAAWKKIHADGHVGPVSSDCKPWKEGPFNEWECHATARACH